MAKAKLDLKKFFIAKGEYVALGVSGFFLAIMLLSAAGKWSSAKNPSDFANPLKSSAQSVYNKIENGEISEEDKKKTELPPWIKLRTTHKDVSVRDFPLSGNPFDPIASPNTKKENPITLPLGSYQVDLVRAPMKGFDIITDNQGSLKIAVIASSKIGKVDQDKIKTVGEKIKGNKNVRPSQVPPPKKDGGGQTATGQPPGVSNPYGNASSAGFDGSAERVEKSIEYVPIDELETAIADQKAPAMTVIPLRMVLIHAEIPLKEQIAQFQKALRLPNMIEAGKVGPIYDGYEVRRRISRVLPSGKEEIIADWAPYDFEEKYADLINSRKMADNFEDGYLAHFIRYEEALALPLPQLVAELGKYPKIRLEGINKTISAWENAKKPKPTQSDLAERLKNQKGGKTVYKPQTGNDTGAGNIYGGEVGGPLAGGKGGVQPKDNKNNPVNTTPADVEHLLLRFVDVDVKPGYTYQYQIRLRMKNPNFGKRNEVANPSYADKEFLESKWSQINTPITIPAESYLFAVDVAGFRKKIDETYADNPALQKALQVKDNQAVVEICTWMEEIRTDSAGKREPVGAWVVADIPVGRGEYIGRKQYIKLPLWSSENRAYLLRELQDMVLPKGPPGGKEPPKPKGWLVDFSTKNVLVDFEGGKVETRVGVGGTKRVVDDVGTELLIVRSDNKLVVKKSTDDEVDENRTTIAGGWTEWIKLVSGRKEGSGSDSEYDKKKDKQ